MKVEITNPVTVGPNWQLTKTLDSIAMQMTISNRIQILDRLLEHRAMTESEYITVLKEMCGK